VRVLVSTANMDRREWLEWRRRGIGSSDAPAIAGLVPGRTPLLVWAEKVGEVAPSVEPPSEEALWGQLLEDIIAREVERRTGFRVRRRRAIIQHDTYNFMLANLDRLIHDPQFPRAVPLEIKTTSAHRRDEWDDDGVPERVLVQVQHQIATTGAPAAYVAALIGGQRLVIRTVPRDDELIRDLIELEREFWRLVETKTPPPWDGSDVASELLRKRYPRATEGAEIVLPPDAIALIERYEDAQRRAKEAEAEAEAAKQALQAMLGDAERGIAGDRVVIWKNVTRTSLDSKALKAAHPAIYAEFARESTYRRFEIK